MNRFTRLAHELAKVRKQLAVAPATSAGPANHRGPPRSATAAPHQTARACARRPQTFPQALGPASSFADF